MSRRAALITQAQIARALRAVKKIAPEGFVIEIKGAVINIVPASLANFVHKKEIENETARGLEIVP